MIRFSVSRSGGRCTGFTCCGHSGWSVEGRDIVCAAVSALTVNTVNSIEALTEDEFSVEQAEDGGYLKLTLSEEPSEAALVLMESLVLGMHSICEAYGEDFISIEASENGTKPQSGDSGLLETSEEV